ncbi:MAG: sigma-70 family RNA polymerase sigma factor, partial [Blautia sp.]|nr:sigma-70 family RNA polymerase sigma factor [Blautia sp.]
LLPGGGDPEEEIVEQLQQEQLKETLWATVDKLPEPQPEVLRMRYLEDQTFKKISEQVGRGYQRTVQIHNDALRQLRRPRYRKKLDPFLDGEIYSSGLKGNGVGQFNRSWTSSTERAALKLADPEDETKGF